MSREKKSKYIVIKTSVHDNGAQNLTCLFTLHLFLLLKKQVRRTFVEHDSFDRFSNIIKGRKVELVIYSF